MNFGPCYYQLSDPLIPGTMLMSPLQNETERPQQMNLREHLDSDDMDWSSPTDSFSGYWSNNQLKEPLLKQYEVTDEPQSLPPLTPPEPVFTELQNASSHDNGLSFIGRLFDRFATRHSEDDFVEDDHRCTDLPTHQEIYAEILHTEQEDDHRYTDSPTYQKIYADIRHAEHELPVSSASYVITPTVFSAASAPATVTLATVPPVATSSLGPMTRGRGRPRATGPAPTPEAEYMRQYRLRQKQKKETTKMAARRTC